MIVVAQMTLKKCVKLDLQMGMVGQLSNDKGWRN